MSKHTPGPWRVNGDYFVEHMSAKMLSVIPVASAYFACQAGDLGKDEMAANARLIAAAPELIEALKEIRQSVINKTSVAPSTLRLIERVAEQAIAKVEGQCKIK